MEKQGSATPKKHNHHSSRLERRLGGRVEDILARLLEGEGYCTSPLGAHHTGLNEEPLDGMDILLFGT